MLTKHSCSAEYN